jgi:hypothetical protein
VRQETAALRKFDPAYDCNGSKPVSLKVSKCFPVCLRKRTSDLRVNEYTPGGPISVQAAMALGAKNLGIEQGSIGTTADMVQLELHLAAAPLAAILCSQERRSPDY